MYTEDLVEVAANRGIIQFFTKGGRKRKVNGKWLGGHRKGVMVAIPIDGDIDEVEAPRAIGVGFSLCKTKPSAEEIVAGITPDEFDAILGLRIATFRAVCEKPVLVPKSMRKKVMQFRDRAQRYFKNATIVTNIVFEDNSHENTQQASA